MEWMKEDVQNKVQLHRIWPMKIVAGSRHDLASFSVGIWPTNQLMFNQYVKAKHIPYSVLCNREKQNVCISLEGNSLRIWFKVQVNMNKTTWKIMNTFKRWNKFFLVLEKYYNTKSEHMFNNVFILYTTMLHQYKPTISHEDDLSLSPRCPVHTSTNLQCYLK